MKSFTLSSLILFFFLIEGIAQQKLEVHVTGIISSSGAVLIALYDSESNYMRASYKELSISATGQDVIVVFDDIPDGVYAISSFYDENGNEAMDTGLFGIPKEKYCFSNNAKGTFGPSKFADAKFEVAGKNRKHYLKY